MMSDIIPAPGSERNPNPNKIFFFARLGFLCSFALNDSFFETPHSLCYSFSLSVYREGTIMAKNKVKVLVLLGSASDREVMNRCAAVLEEFSVSYELTVSSAHRSPERTRKLVAEAAGRGVKVIIAAAGLAAHLAGVAASHTALPVIGVPMAAGPLKGIDALLSTVQMPPGVPVATVAIGDVGAKNAAYLALRILALSDPALARKLKSHQARMAREVEQAAKRLS
jgi:phosphoribosylaminoimidazole carboxylase PurE protein